MNKSYLKKFFKEKKVTKKCKSENYCYCLLCSVGDIVSCCCCYLLLLTVFVVVVVVFDVVFVVFVVIVVVL